jgi:hypothetical protein
MPKIKFKPVIADADYSTKYEEALAYFQKVALKDIDFITTREIHIENKFSGYVGTIDYQHTESKSRMLCIVSFYFNEEVKEDDRDKVLEELIRKNKNDYFQIYSWVDKEAAEDLEHFMKLGTCISRDPSLPSFTKNYKRDDLIELDNKLAVLFWENGERIK